MMMMMRSTGSSMGVEGGMHDGTEGEMGEGVLMKAGSFRSFVFDEDMTLDNYIDACGTTMDIDMASYIAMDGAPHQSYTRTN